MRKLLLTLIVGATVAVAQPKTASIEGRVLNQSGEPLSKATVRIPGAGPLDARITSSADDQGRFVFENLSPGRYTLTAERSGFITQKYGATSIDSPGVVLAIKAGGDLKNIVFKLMPQAVIAGNVTDRDGEPVPRRQVRALRRVFVRGGRTSRIAGSAITDDQGNYRIANLAPGRYYLESNEGNLRLVGPVMLQLVDQGPPARETDMPTFYPSEPDLAHAKPLDLSSGEELHGIDIRLRRLRVYSIRVKASTAANTGRVSDQILTISPADGAGTNQTARIGDNGEFEFRNLIPGEYIIRSTGLREPGAGPRLFGSAKVSVGSSDVEGVSLILISGLNVTGTFKIEGSDSPQRFDVVFEGTGRDALFANGEAREDGAVTVRGIAPATYRIDLRFALTRPIPLGEITAAQIIDAAAVPGAYLKAIRFGNQDAIHSPLDLTGGTAGSLDIVFSTKVGEIAGIVKNDEDKPVAGITVSVWPKIPELGLIAGGAHSATTDQNGNFEIRDLGPGDYYVAGWEDIDPGLVRYAEFLNRFNGEAATVMLTEGGQAMIQVKLINKKGTADELARLP